MLSAAPSPLLSPASVRPGDLLLYRREDSGKEEKVCVREVRPGGARSRPRGFWAAAGPPPRPDDVSFVVQFADGRVRQTRPSCLWLLPNVVRTASPPPPPPSSSSTSSASSSSASAGGAGAGAGAGGALPPAAPAAPGPLYVGSEEALARDVALHKIRRRVLAGAALSAAKAKKVDTSDM